MEWEDLVPPEGTVTLCEINCSLVNADPEGAGGSGKRQGPPAGPTYPEICLSNSGHTKFLAEYAPVISIEESSAPSRGGNGLGDGPALQRIFSDNASMAAPSMLERVNALLSPLVSLVSRLGVAHQVTDSGAGGPPPFAWHPREQVMAAADTADRVHLYDVGSSAPKLGSAQAEYPPPLLPKLVLYHEFQRQVGAVEWRPPCGSMLAVGCLRGICLWNISGGPAGNTAGQSGRGTGASWMTFLRARGSSPVTSLAWSPCGRLLASASVASPGVDVWHVALGVATHIRTTLGGARLLRWSPCGSYLLCGGLGDKFVVWDTEKWRSQSWTCSGIGHLVEASWQPGGRAVALAFSRSTQIVMLHFISPPPELRAQMLPLDLPDLRMSKNPEAVEIQSMAWDQAGGRLAVAIEGDHLASGLVALYATSGDALVSAYFLGFVRPRCITSVQKDADGRYSHQHFDAFVRIAFQGSFNQGALLAVRNGDAHISMMPMYFSRP